MLNQTVFSADEFKKSFPKVVLNYQGWPRRNVDRHVLLLSIAACFDCEKEEYREIDVNDLILTWIAHFGRNLNLDHVTLRRELVDARILRRRDDGQCYSIIADRALFENVAVIRSVDLEKIVQAEQRRRERLRQQYRNTQGMSLLYS